MRRTRIRERGLPLELVVISDLTQALSEQELQAWQRLVRVLGHELNNSLTPIKSIAGSLVSIIAREPLPDDWRDDMRRGLHVITSRSESLSRFIGAYARLAKLPRPQLQPLDVARLRRPRRQLRNAPAGRRWTPGPNFTMQGDPDQLEQVLINLLRNAADASLTTNGGVRDRLAARRLDAGDLDQGRRPGPLQHGQSLRPVLHHQARRHRASAWCSAARSPKATAAR